MNGIWKNCPECGGENVKQQKWGRKCFPTRNFNGGYMKKTYKEMIEDISPDEIDELYYFLEEHTEKNISKDAEVIG